MFDESDFKNLRSLEICGGGLTDTGVKNIKDLSSLMVLNLSQNSNLTDKTLELISGSSINYYYFFCKSVQVERNAFFCVDNIRNISPELYVANIISSIY